jgi:hypothetical protein
MAAYSVFKRVKRQGRRFHVAKSTGRTTVVGTVGWLGKLAGPTVQATPNVGDARGPKTKAAARWEFLSKAPATWNDISSQESIHRRGIVALCRCPSGQKAPAPPTLGAAPTQGGPQITDHWTSQCRGIVRPASPSRPWRGCAGTAPPTKTRLAPAPLAGGFYSACVSGSIRHWN